MAPPKKRRATELLELWESLDVKEQAKFLMGFVTTTTLPTHPTAPTLPTLPTLLSTLPRKHFAALQTAINSAAASREEARDGKKAATRRRKQYREREREMEEERREDEKEREWRRRFRAEGGEAAMDCGEGHGNGDTVKTGHEPELPEAEALMPNLENPGAEGELQPRRQPAASAGSNIGADLGTDELESITPTPSPTNSRRRKASTKDTPPFPCSRKRKHSTRETSIEPEHNNITSEREIQKTACPDDGPKPKRRRQRKQKQKQKPDGDGKAKEKEKKTKGKRAQEASSDEKSLESIPDVIETTAVVTRQMKRDYVWIQDSSEDEGKHGGEGETVRELETKKQRDGLEGLKSCLEVET